MAGYISFSVPDSGTVLVEVEESEIAGQTGSPIKAGLVDKVKDTVAIAGSTLEEALRRVIGYNVDALYSAVHGVPHPPTEVEMTFALKATGELSNLAVGKLSGEANYTVKLVWKGAQGA